MAENVKGGVIVAIDLDNLLISSAQEGQPLATYSLEEGFHNLFNWVETFGTILAVHVYLSSRTHQLLNDEVWDSLWKVYAKRFFFEYVYCPKTSSETERLIDNVDAHLMVHSQRLMGMFAGQVKYFCLASGDLDYSPMLWDFKRTQGVDISFAPGSKLSFSRVYHQMNIVGKHPVTGEDLIHYFSPMKI